MQVGAINFLRCALIAQRCKIFVKGKSDRRSFDSLRYASVAQDDGLFLLEEGRSVAALLRRDKLEAGRLELNADYA